MRGLSKPELRVALVRADFYLLHPLELLSCPCHEGAMSLRETERL